MFDAWLNSEVFRTVVAMGLFFVVCIVLLVVLLAYLDLAKRLGQRHLSREVPSPRRRDESQLSHVELVSPRDTGAGLPTAQDRAGRELARDAERASRASRAGSS